MFNTEIYPKDSKAKGISSVSPIRGISLWIKFLHKIFSITALLKNSFLLKIFSAVYFKFKISEAIQHPVPVRSGIKDNEYLTKLRSQLNIALKKFSADLVFYNAGTDIMIGDPLGGMLITPEVYIFNKTKCFN